MRSKQTPAVFLMTLFGVMAAVQPAQAGFLDFLFGRSAPAPAPAAAAPSAAPGLAPARAPVVARRPREPVEPALSPKMRADNAARTATMQADDPAALDAFAFDPTLRAGDIVVTRAGFLMFQGKKAPEHTLADFRPFAALDKTKRKPEMVAMETATRVAFRNEPPALTIKKSFATLASSNAAVRSVLTPAKPALTALR